MPTKIEWTDETWNPVRARLRADPKKVGWHCEHDSPGCVNCYAEKLNHQRFGTGLPYKPGHRKDVEIFLDEKVLLKPLHWRKARRVFVCSMTDLFADFVTDAMIDQVFAMMALCPQHTFQVLTKRADRMRAYFDDLDERLEMIGVAAGNMLDGDWIWNEGKRFRDAIEVVVSRSIGLVDDPEINALQELLPLPNVWLGVSVEDQQRANERIPDLLATPAAVRFLSCEPLLGPVDLRKLRPDSINMTLDALTGQGEHFLGMTGQTGAIAWVICGGESGPGARPMHPDWARSLRDQCAAAGVPFFFKQWGAWAPNWNGLPVKEVIGSGDPDCAWPDGTIAWGKASDHGGCGEFLGLVGKKAAGRLLDGVEHNEMPA